MNTNKTKTPVLRTRYQKAKFTRDGEPFVICYRKKLFLKDFLKKEVLINGTKKTGNYAVNGNVYLLEMAAAQEVFKITIAE